MRTSIFSMILTTTIIMILSGCAPAVKPPSPAHTFTPTFPANPPAPTLTPTLAPSPTGSNTLASLEPASILFQQDFDKGDYFGISLYQPYWQMAGENGDQYLCSVPGDYYAGLSFGLSSWMNYAVELRFMEVDHQAGLASTAGIYFRYDPSTNTGDAALLDVDGHFTDLLLNQPSEDVSHTSYDTVQNTWYTLRVEIAGQQARFYIDGRLVGSGRDASFRFGAANFSVSPHEKICVNDIRVWALDENGEVARAGTPDPTLVATLENNPQDI